MPDRLTPEELQKLDALMGGQQAPAAPVADLPPAAVPATAPEAPAGLEFQSMTVGGRRPTMRFGKPKEAPAAKPPKAIPQGQLKQLQDTEHAITRLQKLIPEMREKQYKTGPMSPRFWRGKVGNAAMQYKGNADERVFKAENERFMNDYVTAQSGAARGFKEIDWMSGSVPNPENDLPENYLANAESTLQDLQDKKQQMLDLLAESGYQVPTEQDANTAAPTLSPGAQSTLDRHRARRQGR